jgi:hypothetical protein
MPLFEFDEQYPLFDATPVENLFVQEYLPAAKGDYVKVYLYGLMHTYHPTAGMNLAVMARDLGLSEEDVLSAYRIGNARVLFSAQRTILPHSVT